MVKFVLFLGTGAIAFVASSVIPATGMISVVIKALVAFIVSNIIFLIIYAKSKEFNYLKTVAMGFLRKKQRG